MLKLSTFDRKSRVQRIFIYIYNLFGDSKCPLLLVLIENCLDSNELLDVTTKLAWVEGGYYERDFVCKPC